MGTPVNRLKSLIDVSLFVHLTEYLDLCGLKARFHCEIGVLPVAYYAEALELGHLSLYPIFSEFLTCVSELGNAHLCSVELVLFDDGALYGHTVVVPAGYIHSVKTVHHLIFIDKILENLVHGCSHVDIVVAERRAVMKNIFGQTLVLLSDHFVKAHLLIVLEHSGLSVGQTRSHRKIGRGQIKRFIVILFHLYKFPSISFCLSSSLLLHNRSFCRISNR